MFMALISRGFHSGELSPGRAILPSDDVDRLPLLLPERAALTQVEAFSPRFGFPFTGGFLFARASARAVRARPRRLRRCCSRKAAPPPRRPLPEDRAWRG